MAGFDARALEHAHVEIAEGRWVLRIEMEVLAVLEAAAGEEDGEIFRGVAAGVAEVAAGENGGAVEEVEEQAGSFADRHDFTCGGRAAILVCPALPGR